MLSRCDRQLPTKLAFERFDAPPALTRLAPPVPAADPGDERAHERAQQQWKQRYEIERDLEREKRPQDYLGVLGVVHREHRDRERNGQRH